jgi:hypothetical protein
MPTDYSTPLSPEDRQRLARDKSNHVRHRRSYTIFLILEGGFIALVWYCYSLPLPLPTYTNLLEFKTVKSGVIVIFNLWHKIATAIAAEICFEAFSREWRAGKNKDDPTDEVSKVTSGLLNRAKYASKFRSASKTYITAFVLSLGLALIGMIGSSAIVATDGIQSPQHLDIGIINTPSLAPNTTNMDNLAFRVRLSEANMIVRLERLAGEPWGYVPQPNYLIPLPAEPLNDTTQVKYESDVVHFSYQCHWQAPDNFVNSTMTIGNETWTGAFRSQPKNNTTISKPELLS